MLINIWQILAYNNSCRNNTNNKGGIPMKTKIYHFLIACLLTFFMSGVFNVANANCWWTGGYWAYGYYHSGHRICNGYGYGGWGYGGYYRGGGCRWVGGFWRFGYWHPGYRVCGYWR